MRHFGRRWQRFWFEPESTASLAILRIAVGFLSFAWALALLPDLYAFFSAHGVEPVPPGHLAAGSWGVLNFFPGYSVALVLYAAMLVASLCLLVGYRTRWASLVVFVAIISFENRAPSIWNSGDGLLRILTFLLMLAPAGESLSIDRWRTNRQQFWEFPRRAPWAMRLIQVQISVLYLSSVWLKLHGPEWRDGTAVSYAIRLQDFQRFALPHLLSHSLLFSSLMTYWTLAVELMIGILVWNRAARPLVLFLGVALHLGLDFNLRLGFFSEAILVSYLAFLSPVAAERGIVAVRYRTRGGLARVQTLPTGLASPVASWARRNWLGGATKDGEPG
jgi:hypothetical protein